MTSQSDARALAKKRLTVILLGGLAGVAAGIAGIYGMGAVMRNAAVPETCRPAAELARKLQPLARGEVAALAMRHCNPSTTRLRRWLFRGGLGVVHN